MYRLAIHLTFLLGLLAPAITASPFLRIYTYGDSLSDPLFTNGPVAVELLAGKLGVTPASHSNFAVGGATTGVGNYADGGLVSTPSPRGGMTTQLNDTIAGIDPADSLFVVWGGPNDFLAPDPDVTFPEGVAARAITNLVTIVMRLKGAGAENILVPGLPDLGLTPFYQSMPAPAAANATALSLAFNQGLRASLPADVIFIDTATLMRHVIDNPAAFGFSNVTGSCLTPAGVCSNPDEYLFWDGFHPTAAAHEILAERFEAAVVPEPGTVVLVLGGIGAAAVARRVRPGLRRR
ncbi:MAG TPA: SGNH/GDSL hydrolase family protein [Bryobacteraceae bacterium]|nr:SGNH/GDSL hydrolase family protein [Bryobacteraceae bacterium]